MARTNVKSYTPSKFTKLRLSFVDKVKPNLPILRKEFEMCIRVYGIETPVGIRRSLSGLCGTMGSLFVGDKKVWSLPPATADYMYKKWTRFTHEAYGELETPTIVSKMKEERDLIDEALSFNPEITVADFYAAVKEKKGITRTFTLKPSCESEPKYLKELKDSVDWVPEFALVTDMWFSSISKSMVEKADDDILAKLVSLAASYQIQETACQLGFLLSSAAIESVVCRAWLQAVGVLNTHFPTIEVDGDEYVDILGYLKKEYQLEDEHVEYIRDYISTAEGSKYGYTYADCLNRNNLSKINTYMVTANEANESIKPYLASLKQFMDGNDTSDKSYAYTIKQFYATEGLCKSYLEEFRMRSLFYHFVECDGFCFQYCSSVSGLLMDYIEGRYEIDSDESDYEMDLLFLHSCQSTMEDFRCWMTDILEESIGDLADSVTKLQKQIDSLQDENRTLSEKNAGIKKALKETKKKLESHQYEVHRTKKALTKATKDSEEAEKLSVDDYRAMEETLKKRDDKIESLVQKQGELERTCSKQKREIEELQGKLGELGRDATHTKRMLQKQKTHSESIEITKSLSDIPLEAFITAIQPFKITLIGCDMLHSKIQESGLDNIKAFKAGSRNVKNYDIIGKRLVVIATDYIDHASIGDVTNTAKNNGVDLIYFNNRNFEMLVYEMFKAIYG